MQKEKRRKETCIIDLAAFKADIDALGARLRAEQAGPAEGAAHIAHLRRVSTVASAMYALGVATMPLPVYTVMPWLCLSTATFARWAMVAHHVSHGGYERWRPRRTFARGMRRFWDWFDWIQPEAWNHEHNKMHHSDRDTLSLTARWASGPATPTSSRRSTD